MTTPNLEGKNLGDKDLILIALAETGRLLRKTMKEKRSNPCACGDAFEYLSDLLKKDPYKNQIVLLIRAIDLLLFSDINPHHIRTETLDLAERAAASDRNAQILAPTHEHTIRNLAGSIYICHRRSTSEDPRYSVAAKYLADVVEKYNLQTIDRVNEVYSMVKGLPYTRMNNTQTPQAIRPYSTGKIHQVTRRTYD